MKLDTLHINHRAKIMAIAEDVISTKLTDMGLYPGKEVELLYRAPFGDPIAIDIDGYTLTLRREEASLIEVG